MRLKILMLTYKILKGCVLREIKKTGNDEYVEKAKKVFEGFEELLNYLKENKKGGKLK